MSTEDIIEDFIQKGIKAYKKLYRATIEGHKLDRHESVLEVKNESYMQFLRS